MTSFTLEPVPVSLASELPAEGRGLLAPVLHQLLKLLAATPLLTINDLLSAARIAALSLVAGSALMLTGAALGAIQEIPLLGGLVGLVSLLNVLARMALRQQKRAELLERIRQVRRQLWGIGV